MPRTESSFSILLKNKGIEYQILPAYAMPIKITN